MATIVPKMTSNTSPSGIVSASSIYSTSYEPWKAFDGVTRNSSTNNPIQGWITQANIKTGWIQYQFTSKKRVTEYALTCSQNVKECPKKWTIEGSNDGVSWSVLDSRSGITEWKAGEKLIFNVVSPEHCLIYRLNISENNGDSSYVGISEIEMTDFSNKILLSSGGKYFSTTKDNSKYDLIPQMTSNTAPSGVVSSADGNSIAFRAFRSGMSYATATNVKSGYIQYEFPTSQIINKYSLFAGTTIGGLSQNIISWTLSGSDNGSTWKELDRQTSVFWSVASEKKEFIFANVTPYKMYRLSFTDSGNTTNAYVRELQLDYVDDIIPIKLDNAREVEFLNYGFEKASLNRIFSKLIDVETDNIGLDSGKTFEHTVDMSKRRVDKITLG